MTQGARIKLIRKKLGYSLERFGEPLGVQKSAISKLEADDRNLTDAMAKAICREYHVSLDWLLNGGPEEDAFTDFPETVLDEICADYNCDDLDKALIREYLALPPEAREILKDYLRKAFG